ncbi:MAG: PIN domain-containing protein [Fuerstia sp.]|nr:PIN domain-containing protein [Fuerstiella sp.]
MNIALDTNAYSDFMRGEADRVQVLSPDDQTTHHYAQLYLQLRKKSVSMPTNDLWIAALVVQHNLILCTSDAHFQHLPQIPKC